MKMKTAIEQPGRFGCTAVMIAVFALVLSLALVLPGGDVDAEAEVTADETGRTALQDMIDAAGTAPITIKLTEDVIGSITIGSGQHITINLNGHTITDNATARDNESIAHHTIINNGNLTIIGMGTVKNLTHGSAALVNNEGAIAILSGGSFERPDDKGTDTKSSDNKIVFIDGGNSYYTVQNLGTMTINSGVSISNAGHCSSTLVNGWYSGLIGKIAVMTINGGTVSGGLHAVKNDDGGKLTINGGTFIAGSSNRNNSFTTQYPLQNSADVTINGGYFKPIENARYAFYSYTGSTVGPANIRITGGSFEGNMTIGNIPDNVSVEGMSSLRGEVDIGKYTFYIQTAVNIDSATVKSNGNTVQMENLTNRGIFRVIGGGETKTLGTVYNTTSSGGSITCSGPNLSLSTKLENDVTLKIEPQYTLGTTVAESNIKITSSFEQIKGTMEYPDIYVGDTVPLNLSIAGDVTWNSSDDKVATVSEDGKVTGVSAGTVTITADSDDKTVLRISMTVLSKAPTNPWYEEEEDEFIPIIPPIVNEVASDDDDSVTVVACAAAAAVAALMAVFLLLDRKR